jgi:hypothetical protein
VGFFFMALLMFFRTRLKAESTCSHMMSSVAH